MKRKAETKNSAVFGDILQATSAEQRAWIGAVVLAYNQAEISLHKLVGSSLGFIALGPTYTVTARINGTEGLVVIIEQAITAISLSDEQKQIFTVSLKGEGFSKLKTLRDAVIHGALSDTGTNVAEAPG